MRLLALTRRLRRLLPLLSLIILCLLFIAQTNRFLTSDNLLSLVRQYATYMVMAFGMTLVIVSGGIDLSVGSVLAFSGVVAAEVIVERHAPVALGILIAIAAGALWGLVNGVVISAFKVPPFIATLGTMGIVRGIALQITNGGTVEGLPPAYQAVEKGDLFGVIPVPLILMVATGLLTWFVMVGTRLGRYAYAIGSNTQAARFSGVNIPLTLAGIYTLNGALVGVGALIETARLSSAQSTAGIGYELNVIAAVVIGGGSLSGGEGSIGGTVIGTLIIAVLQNGCDLLQVPPFIQQIIIGALVIAAVALDSWRRRLEAK